MAAGVSAALDPNASVSSILDAMQRNSSFVVRRAMEFAMRIAKSVPNVDAFLEKFYETRLDWTAALPDGQWNIERYFSPSALEILPASVGLFYLLDGDVNQCIIEGASFGRDCDTIGGVVGALAGAYQGASAIKRQWIEQVEHVNEGFFKELEGDESRNFLSMAERLVGAIRGEQAQAVRRAQELKWMLDPRSARD